jgi:hypothetical protein
MPPRKHYLLRIPQELYDVYEVWASDELRSVNAQIEATLADAARRAGRMAPRRRPDGVARGVAEEREGASTETLPDGGGP